MLRVWRDFVRANPAAKRLPVVVSIVVRHCTKRGRGPGTLHGLVDPLVRKVPELRELVPNARILVDDVRAPVEARSPPHADSWHPARMIRSASDYRRCCEELEALGARPASLDRSGKVRDRIEVLLRERALYEALLREGLSAVPVYPPEHRGRALVDLRVALRVPQNVLAERLGVTAPVISRDEATGYEGCSLERYGRILRALGVEEAISGYRNVGSRRGELAFHDSGGPAYTRTKTRGTIDSKPKGTKAEAAPPAKKAAKKPAARKPSKKAAAKAPAGAPKGTATKRPAKKAAAKKRAAR
jgi:hypothetical protein